MVIFHSYVNVCQRVNGGLDKNQQSMAMQQEPNSGESWLIVNNV